MHHTLQTINMCRNGEWLGQNAIGYGIQAYVCMELLYTTVNSVTLHHAALCKFPKIIFLSSIFSSLAAMDMHACERAYNVWAHGNHLSCLPFHDEVPIWMIYHYYSPWHFTPQDYASKTSYSGACDPSRGSSFIGFCLPTVLSAHTGRANPNTIRHKPYYTNYDYYYYTNIITNYTNIIILLRGN